MLFSMLYQTNDTVVRNLTKTILKYNTMIGNETKRGQYNIEESKRITNVIEIWKVISGRLSG